MFKTKDYNPGWLLKCTILLFTYTVKDTKNGSNKPSMIFSIYFVVNC